MRRKVKTPKQFIHRYPAVTAHLIADSLGYFTPLAAARAGLDAIHGRENFCEYIYSTFECSAGACLNAAIKNRHNHKGAMADYKMARKHVDRYLEYGDEPMFASWF
jgi:hypothetical protein